MKKLMTRAAVLCGTLATSAVALAEGQTPPEAPNLQTVATNLQNSFTGNINIAATALVAVLTAGVVIVGAMYIWGILKRAFRSSK